MSTTETCENVALDQEDLNVTDGAPGALEAGVELKRWWEEVDAKDSYEGKFKEAFVHNRPEDHSFGFFETAELKSGTTDVIGNVQQQLFHRPKAGTPEFVRDQVREFVLRYFMRVSDYRTPQPEAEEEEVEGPLKFVSMFPTDDDYKLQGFGYSQRYFKKRGVDEIEKFAEKDQKAILDIRDLKKDYDFTIIRNPILSFQMNIRPLGTQGPDLSLPIPSAANWVVMSPDTITIDENPGEGLLARYGIGYAFMKDPGDPGMFAYGPGQLEPTVQTLVWEVKESGDVIVRMSFVSAAPKGILNMPVNPMEWGLMAAELFSGGMLTDYLSPLRRAVKRVPFSGAKFDPVFPTVDLLNLMTMGAAGRTLGISKAEINKTLTYAHFLQHYNAVLGSRQTWELFLDWTDEEALPEWVKSGESV